MSNKLFRDATLVAVPLESFAVKVQQKRKGPWIYVYINGIEFLLSENTYNDDPKRLFYDFKYAKKTVMLEVYCEDDIKNPGKSFLYNAKLEANTVIFEAIN